MHKRAFVPSAVMTEAELEAECEELGDDDDDDDDGEEEEEDQEEDDQEEADEEEADEEADEAPRPKTSDPVSSRTRATLAKQKFSAR